MLGPQFRFILIPPSQKDDDSTIEVHGDQGWVGAMQWSENKLQEIDVHPKYQRQGIATQMWVRAQQAHTDAPYHFPKPEPSDFRTKDGDEWAQALYGRGLSEEPPENTMWTSDEDEYDR